MSKSGLDHFGFGIGTTDSNQNLCYRNRYLILDVLGQGTFGQVVKCQNLKTQEVVAVKVVKNRTAYFNQSMMEVSVLDLVSVVITTLVHTLVWLMRCYKN